MAATRYPPPELAAVDIDSLLRGEFQWRPPYEWRRLHGDGSQRRFYRLTAGAGSMVVVAGDPDDAFPNENDAYVYMARHLKSRGIAVPEIYLYLQEHGVIFIQDLGDTLLQEAVKMRPGQAGPLYRQALEILLKLQVTAAAGFDPGYCYDTPVYDAAFALERELRYFYQSFIRDGLGLPLQWEDLAADFELLAARATAVDQDVFMHRDLQARNIMCLQERLYLIDFQGARLGPPTYDLASLLLDPYVDLPFGMAEELAAAHLQTLASAKNIAAVELRQTYYHTAICRVLQALAAFSFLGRCRGRKHFFAYVEPGWRRLTELLAQKECTDYGNLRRLVATVGAAELARLGCRRPPGPVGE